MAPADVHNRDPRTLPLVSGGATVYGDGVLASTGNVVFCQLPPFQVSKGMGGPPQAVDRNSSKNADSEAGSTPGYLAPGPEQFNLRRTFGRTSFAVSRLLANLGVSGSTPLLERFGSPVGDSQGPSALENGDLSINAEGDGLAGRCLEGLYLTRPTEWDDPYRFFRW